MRASMRRLSLVLTLGIAAIDMLSCAFVSSILLFVMFLLPQQSSGGGGATGAENYLLVHWSFTSRYETALGIELEAPGDAPRVIWSDDPESIVRACANFSSADDYMNSCRFILPADSRDLDGMLLVQQPRKGDWKIVIRNADSTSHGNFKEEQPVNVMFTIVGSDSISRLIKGLSPGGSVELSNISALHFD